MVHKGWWLELSNDFNHSLLVDIGYNEFVLIKKLYLYNFFWDESISQLCYISNNPDENICYDGWRGAGMTKTRLAESVSLGNMFCT